MCTDRNLILMILAMYAVREIFVALSCRLVVRKRTEVYGNTAIANVSSNRENQ
jgi:hypothetical protein